MSERNVCPHCGGEVIAGFVEFRGVQGYQAQCKRCGAKGSVLVVASEVWHIEILEAFCHPAHLMATLHTYDPKTQIVVSREAGQTAVETIERCLGDGFREYFDGDENNANDEALVELRAALEGKP